MSPPRRRSSDLRARRVRSLAVLLGLAVVCALAVACRGAAGPVDPDGSRPDRTAAATRPGAAPVDYSGPGPYPVGTRTMPLEPTRCAPLPGSTFGCPQSAVVYYPADPASAGAARKITGYSTGVAFPDTLRALAPKQIIHDVTFAIDVFEGPKANTEGPFPLVLHSHDMASFDLFESRYLAHLASWGFVAAAPDHQARSVSGQLVKQPYGGDSSDIDDLQRTLASLRKSNVEPSPIHGAIDLSHVVVSGHGVGAMVAIKFAADPGILAYIAKAPTSVPDVVARDKPGLVISGDADEHVPPADMQVTFDKLGDRARHVVVRRAGHNTFLDMCAPIHAQGGLTQYAADLPTLAELLRTTEDGCEPERIDPAKAEAIVNHLAVAHLRWALGMDRSDVALGAEFLARRFGEAFASARAPGSG